MGEVDLSDSEDEQPSFVGGIVKNPVFFVVDDMYNRHDRMLIVECEPAHVDAVVIESLSAMMRVFPGWWVSFRLGDSGLLVSSDCALVGGRRFWDCTSVLEVSERCQSPVDFGPSESVSQAMKDFWRILVVGGIDQTVQLPIAPSRQWAEIIHSVEMMRSKRPDGSLSASAYDQVRYDLHPQTRRELLLQLLKELPAYPAEKVASARRNIQHDLGLALTESGTADAVTELARCISRALESISEKLERIEVVLWWANVLSYIKGPSVFLTRALEETLRADVKASGHLVPLSALFGLARLNVSDLSSILDESLQSHPDWSNHRALIGWLQKLRAGNPSYPDRSVFVKQ